jgi:hypothetical protein
MKKVEAAMKKIKLTQGKEAIVDDDDYEMLMEHKWYADKDYTIKSKDKFYVKRSPPRDSNGKQKNIPMHRQITNAPEGMQVDHINGNTLDNRKENLRICTNQQNQMNRGRANNNKSGYKGVCYRKKKKDMINEYSKPWQARIKHNQKQIYLGMYKTKEEAARAYDKKAIELHGEFAQLNFP